MLSIVSAASAFSGPMPMARPAVQPMMVEKSAAIPFLKKPPALDGSMPGDVGFDPLGFSTTITELGGDLNYVREAELMHGRQAMLAVVGFVAPALFGKLPVGWTADVSTNPLEAQYQLPPEVFYQVVISIFIAEGLRAQVTHAHTQTARSPLFRRTQRAQPHTAFTASSFLVFYCSPIVPHHSHFPDHLRQGQHPWRARLRPPQHLPEGPRGALQAQDAGAPQR